MTTASGPWRGIVPGMLLAALASCAEPEARGWRGGTPASMADDEVRSCRDCRGEEYCVRRVEPNVFGRYTFACCDPNLDFKRCNKKKLGEAYMGSASDGVFKD